MFIPDPVQLPSGSWRVRVVVNGKRISKTFLKRSDAVKWAAATKTEAREEIDDPEKITVGRAVDKYVEEKAPILSASTIAGYKKIKANAMTSICAKRIEQLNQEAIQRWINDLVRSGKSPKTIANAHGLLSAVLRAYRPNFTLRTTLPQKVKADIKIPTEAELKTILTMAEGTKYELPIALAVWLGLRQSEIVGLKWSDIDGDTVHIKRAIVKAGTEAVEKGTKTFSGKRDIHIPKHLKALLQAQERESDYVINMSGKAIYSGFCRLCKANDLPHFRFHDLRHANASIMLAVGVPDKYAMRRMGHATNNMLKTTYQHTIKEKEKEFDRLTEDYLEKLRQS